ncbi:2OG-FeII-Oxy-2 domain-containing protein [Aphelenchoides fujianensis]|nr:2OG-FeII-Oxy-2 domain-containing protein [Aphelenchoides fujianensis]
MIRAAVRRFCSAASSSNVHVHNEAKWPAEVLRTALSSCRVVEDFVTEAEEQKFMDEIEPHMKRLRYERAHWDDAIYLYREREQKKWTPENEAIVQRILGDFFSCGRAQDPVRPPPGPPRTWPHQAAHRRRSAGSRFLSASVMRLRHKDRKDEWILDLRLPRRSLYILSDATRFDFTHEILSNEESFFRGLARPRKAAEWP